MATVTYHGPRPELFVSLPVKSGDLFIDRDGQVRHVRWETRGANRFWRPEGVHFIKDVPMPTPALFAFGLACIRRRPSPWFTVRLDRGEWAEVAHRVVGRVESCPCSLFTDTGDPNSGCLECRGTGQARQSPLRALGWSRQQVEAVYYGDQKVVWIAGEPAPLWAPAGWTP